MLAAIMSTATRGRTTWNSDEIDTWGEPNESKAASASYCFAVVYICAPPLNILILYCNMFFIAHLFASIAFTAFISKSLSLAFVVGTNVAKSWHSSAP